MFVGGGVEDDLRPVGRKDTPQPQFIIDVPHQGDDLRLRKGPPKFPIDLEEDKFSPLQQQDTGRLETGHLPGQLGTDGPPGPGDHDPLPGKKPTDDWFIELNHLPAQQVLDLDVPDAGNLVPSLEQFIQPGDHPDLDRKLPAGLEKFHIKFPGGLVNGHHHLFDPQAGNQSGNIPGGAQDLDPLNLHPLTLGIVIHKPQDLQPHAPMVGNLLDGHGPPAAGADQQGRDPFPGGSSLGGLFPFITLINPAAKDP